MIMNKMMKLAAVLCCAMTTTVVNAQTTEEESISDKYFRLSKIADENPSDWKNQLEVAHILLNKESGFYNQTRAMKYYERIYHTATDINREIPDSILRETFTALIVQATDKKDAQKALYYIDEAKRAEKVGVDLEDASLQNDAWGYFYNLIVGKSAKALSFIMDFRDKVTERNISGIENTDITTAMAFESVLSTYKKMFGDKLIEITFDGKKYIIIASKDWNIEKPLMGWMGSFDDNSGDDNNKPKLMYGEDGKVYDDIHGEMSFSYKWDKKNGIVPQEDANARLITVTPEQRQKMVEAYHKYLNKK